MSNTRRSTSGEFRQERFCSAPEFEGDSISGLSAAKRIAIIKDRSIREILWWIQWRSLAPAGLHELCDELIAAFPDRIGTATLRKLTVSKRQRMLRRSDIRQLREECGLYDSTAEAILDRDFKLSEVPIEEWELDFYKQYAIAAMAKLPRALKNYCLNPAADISKEIWFFHDLVGALRVLRERFISSARSRLADTVVTNQISQTLDFWFARRRMILIEGSAGIGRTATTKAWCDAHAGLVRYVEVPSSSDDRSFYASIARELGVARGTSFNGQQIKVRVEEMLATSDLMVAFDESQYLWTQAMHPRKTPDRLLWIKSAFDAGTPIALIAHNDFSKWQQHYVKRTLWTDEQFERRLNRRITLPPEHSKEDMLKIARAHFPAGDVCSLKLLASYALGTEKKQASGIVEVLESARYRAEQASRAEVTFEDIEAALIHDHAFLNPAPAGDLQQPCKAVAKPPKTPRKIAANSDVPIVSRFSGARINRPLSVET